MAHKNWKLIILSIVLIASVSLAGCTGTQASQTKTTVATFIWTQEFDTLNPLYTNMWFSEVTQQLWNGWAWN